ncbi:MAG: hypothetical protein U0359_15670 [Byssovorax sp.]
MARRARHHLAGSLLALVVAALLPGCDQAFGNRDAKQPGTELGTFHVTATLTQNSCGDGALGSMKSWEFDVKLSRDVDYLFWNNGAQQVASAESSDGSTFHIDADVMMNMRQEGDSGPPCSVARHDAAVVTLPAGATDVTSFTGTLDYDFAPTSGSDCSDLVVGGSPNPKAMPVFAQLPCSFGYSMTATRTKAP